MPSVALAAGAAPRVVAKIHVGSQPCAGVAAFGSFWQTNYGTATLSRVNPATNRVTQTGRLGAQPCGIAAGAGSLWIDGYGTSRIERVNRRDAQGRQANPRRHQRLGRRVRVRLGVGDEQLRRLDRADQPGHEQVVKTIKTGASPRTSGRQGRALGRRQQRERARTSSGSTRRRTRRPQVPSGHPRPSGIIVTADAIWVANGDSTVVRIDPATKAVVATIKVGQLPQQGDVAPDGTIWIPNSERRHDLGHRPADERCVGHDQDWERDARSSLRSGFGDMWVGSFRDRYLWRIRP